MPALQRRLGLVGSMTVGLSSMLGAGAFFVWAPAAAAAGPWLLIGLLLAGIVATLNALSTAQLAMEHPVAGGAYSYGRARLGEWWGFGAGWLFVVGKTASAAAIASVAGAYLQPDASDAVAVGAVVALALLNAGGVRKTALGGGVIVAVVLAGLAVLLVAALATGDRAAVQTPAPPDVLGVLRAAGLLFFAFAGYARLATLGEEARDPRRTLPRAILGALAVTLVLYTAIGATLLIVLGPDRLAGSTSPLADLVGGGPAVLAVGLLAGLACLGSLLAILAGISRTTFAMAREGDLPAPLARVGGPGLTPVVADAVIAPIVIAAVLLLDPTSLVSFSACTVLAYYGVAHLAASRLPAGERWLPRWVPWAGVIGCLLLVFTVQPAGLAAAALALAIGLGGRALAHGARRGPADRVGRSRTGE